MEKSLQRCEDDVPQAVAEQTERENPAWIVIWGTFTKQFVCFPRFDAPPGTVLVARYPGALPSRMRKVESATQINLKGEPTR